MNGRVTAAPRLEARRTNVLAALWAAGDLLAAEALMLPLVAYDDDGNPVEGVNKIARTLTGASSSASGKLQGLNFWAFTKSAAGEAYWQLAHAPIHALLDPFGPPSRRSLVWDDFVQTACFGGAGNFAVGFLDNITAADISTLTGVGFYLRSGSSAVALSRAGWVLAAYATYEALANAIDGNAGTRWSSGTAVTPGTSFFSMDLGSAQTVQSLSYSTDAVNILPTGNIQWSDDGVAWTTIASWVAGDWSGAVLTKSFAAATHRYWRMLATSTPSTPGNWWSIYEINLYAPGVGPAPDGHWHCFVKEAAAGYVAPIATLYDLDTGIAGNYDSTSDVAAAVATLHRLSILVSGPDRTVYFYIDGALVGQYTYAATPGRLGGAAGTRLQYKLFAASGDNQMMRMLWGGSHGLYRVHEAALG